MSDSGTVGTSDVAHPRRPSIPRANSSVTCLYSSVCDSRFLDAPGSRGSLVKTCSNLDGTANTLLQAHGRDPAAVGIHHKQPPARTTSHRHRLVGRCQYARLEKPWTCGAQC